MTWMATDLVFAIQRRILAIILIKDSEQMSAEDRKAESVSPSPLPDGAVTRMAPSRSLMRRIGDTARLPAASAASCPCRTVRRLHGSPAPKGTVTRYGHDKQFNPGRRIRRLHGSPAPRPPLRQHPSPHPGRARRAARWAAVLALEPAISRAARGMTGCAPPHKAFGGVMAGCSPAHPTNGTSK